MARLPDAHRSYAVLIGTSSYQAAELPNVPAVGHFLSNLAGLLTDPTLSSFTPDRCICIEDVTSAPDTHQVLRRFAAQAEDTLLVYFAGYGVIDPARHELFLALKDTDLNELHTTALRFDLIRDAFLSSPATNRVLILDTYFSGHARDFMASSSKLILGHSDIDGTYVLASASTRANYTVFSELLLAVLNHGLSGEPELLTLGAIFRYLQRAMDYLGLQPPAKSIPRAPDRLALVRNRAHQPDDSGRRDRRLLASYPPPLGGADMNDYYDVREQLSYVAADEMSPAPSLLAADVVDFDADDSARPTAMVSERSRFGRRPRNSARSTIQTPPTAHVPFDDSEDPLPHDGLFIRRNNAFGTRSTLGIADFIDQGVMVDQAQVRFDDFVVSKADQVPAPAIGEAIRVSHGTCTTSEGLKAHVETTHFVEIALRAATTPADSTPQPESLPVNFVFVVDTSASMNGEKLDMVKTAIRELYDQLRDTDFLGVVTFDTQVRTLLKATPKNKISPDHLNNAVSDLYASGGTDINLGVLYGLDEISRHSSGRSDIVNCVYLFSDGDPTSGEINWIRIRTNIAEKVRGNVTLSCFGFGSDARMRELEALAGLTGGFATFVATPDDVRLNLVEDLARREHLAAINIQLQIEVDPDITIWHLYGHDLITDPATRAAIERDAEAASNQARKQYGVEALPHLITEDKGIRIFAPDLAFGETYWVVLELQIPPEKADIDVGVATVQYVDTLAHSNRQHRLSLSQTPTLPPEIVFAHAVGLWTSEITFYALDDLYQNDRETAKVRLTSHAQTLARASEFAPIAQFTDDQVTFKKIISLTGNLGQRMSWSDHNPHLEYTMYAMNQFGQVRSGFAKNRYSPM